MEFHSTFSTERGLCRTSGTHSTPTAPRKSVQMKTKCISIYIYYYYIVVVVVVIVYFLVLFKVITNKLDGTMLTNIIRAVDEQFMPRGTYITLYNSSNTIDCESEKLFSVVCLFVCLFVVYRDVQAVSGSAVSSVESAEVLCGRYVPQL